MMVRSPPRPAAVPDAAPIATAGPLVVTPCVVDFGTLPVGTLVHGAVSVKNTSSATVRFRVGRGDTLHTPAGNSCRVIADVGPLAAFLSRSVEVELLTREVGTVERVVQLACAAGTLPIIVRATVTGDAAAAGGAVL